MEARRRALVRAKQRLFGSGDIRTLYTGIGPNRQLLGRYAARSQARRARQGAGGGESARARARRARLARWSLPTQIAGRVRGGRRGAKRDIAVAVNGRIEAVGRTFYLRGTRQESFAVNVPEASLRPGPQHRRGVRGLARGRLRLIGRA